MKLAFISSIIMCTFYSISICEIPEDPIPVQGYIEIWVDDDAPYQMGDPENGTIEYPYNTIQEGMDAFASSSTNEVENIVAVRPGNYNEILKYRYSDTLQPKNITVKKSRVDPSDGRAIISAAGLSSAVVLFNHNNNLAKLEGFTIQNGTGYDDGISLKGGGIYCMNSSPVIKNNTIRYNSAQIGGGIYCGTDSDSAAPAIHPRIENNKIRYNIATGYSEDTDTVLNSGGGGICCWLRQDIDSVFYHSTVNIINNIIEFNTSTRNGAGVKIKTDHSSLYYPQGGSRINISENQIRYNSAF